MARTDGLPVRIVIRYDEIEPLRTKRIRYILDAAYRICSAWQVRPRLRDAVRAAYERTDFEMISCLILDLYAQETRALSRSVKVPAVLAPIRERAAKHLAYGHEPGCGAAFGRSREGPVPVLTGIKVSSGWQSTTFAHS